MIHIVDYGAGNLFSVKNALDYLQIENKITADPADLKESDGIILPGVGAFRDAMTMLNNRLQQASHYWAFASGCRCCLKKAMNSVNLTALA